MPHRRRPRPGPRVERALGSEEYEFERRLSPQETGRLREHLGVPRRGDLLGAIGERFATTHELEAFAGEHGLAGTFRARMGD